MNSMFKQTQKLAADETGKVYVKVFWLTSIVLSLLLTVLLNLIF